MTTNVGFNSNKGDNIAVCVDGDVNSIMHVLLHELAHCTVPNSITRRSFGPTIGSCVI